MRRFLFIYIPQIQWRNLLEFFLLLNRYCLTKDYVFIDAGFSIVLSLLCEHSKCLNEPAWIISFHNSCCCSSFLVAFSLRLLNMKRMPRFWNSGCFPCQCCCTIGKCKNEILSSSLPIHGGKRTVSVVTELVVANCQVILCNKSPAFFSFYWRRFHRYRFRAVHCVLKENNSFLHTTVTFFNCVADVWSIDYSLSHILNEKPVLGVAFGLSERHKIVSLSVETIKLRRCRFGLESFVTHSICVIEATYY
jgi:hypothetical protein